MEARRQGACRSLACVPTVSPSARHTADAFRSIREGGWRAGGWERRREGGEGVELEKKSEGSYHWPRTVASPHENSSETAGNSSRSEIIQCQKDFQAPATCREPLTPQPHGGKQECYASGREEPPPPGRAPFPPGVSSPSRWISIIRA